MVWYSVRVKRGQKLVTCPRTLSQSAPWDLLSIETSRTRTRARFALPAPPTRLGGLDRPGRYRCRLALALLARVLGELVVTVRGSVRKYIRA